MEINFSGCALCDSTWGAYYEIIEETNLFFCCQVCASIYKDIIARIKDFYGIKIINRLDLQGNTRERTFVASSSNNYFKGRIQFTNGKIITFTSEN